MARNAKRDSESLIWDLRAVHSKLKGLGYLIARENEDDRPAPESMESIKQGIGLLLEGLSSDVLLIANEFESQIIES